MNTRCVTASEDRAVCRVMRAAKAPCLRTREQLRLFREGGGRVSITHDAQGKIWALVFYRIIDEWGGAAMERSVYCEAVVFQEVAREIWDQAAQSIRVFLRSLLIVTKCARVIMTVQQPTPEYMLQLKAIGFLAAPVNEICNCCVMMVFSHESAHVGGVIIERILAGNVTTYGEW
jgi:hypothetical protein